MGGLLVVGAAPGACKKIRYRSELDAKIALSRTFRMRKNVQNSHEEERYYQCRRCRGWYLTSLPAELWRIDERS